MCKRKEKKRQKKKGKKRQSKAHAGEEIGTYEGRGLIKPRPDALQIEKIRTILTSSISKFTQPFSHSPSYPYILQ